MEEPSIEKLKALMIEDSADCAALLNHTLIQLKMFGEIKIFMSGEEGMEYLEKESVEDKRALPDIIFLDLNLPGEHGLETLAKIKNFSSSNSIPVIVMTASDDRRNLVESYRKGGTFFIHKPLEKTLLTELLMHMKITGAFKKKDRT